MNLNTILKGDEPSDVGAAIENFYEKKEMARGYHNCYCA